MSGDAKKAYSRRRSFIPTGDPKCDTCGAVFEMTRPKAGSKCPHTPCRGIIKP